MLSITFSEFKKWGCPNCGCDYAVAGPVSGNYCSTGKCKHCNLNFEIRNDKIKCMEDKELIGSMRYGVRPMTPGDPESKPVMEYAQIIKHPREGIEAWHWEPLDERPEEGEYWTPRGVGYDLSGFVKTKKAGERILGMIKEVTGLDDPKSWLDYREHEPLWIQFKFQKEEFDLEKLNELCREDHILTKEKLRQVCIIK